MVFPVHCIQNILLKSWCLCISACFEEATHNSKESISNTEASIHNRAGKKQGVWILHRKLILFMRKPYLLNSVALVHQQGNLTKEPILKIHFFTLLFCCHQLEGRGAIQVVYIQDLNSYDIDQRSLSPRSSQSLFTMPQYSVVTIDALFSKINFKNLFYFKIFNICLSKEK